MKLDRDNNIDFMRLLCMFMIVSMHYFGWGGINNSSDTTKINYILASGIGILCRVAVNCFYMISGYYMKKNDKEISYKSIVSVVANLYKKVWFYSVLIFTLFCISDRTLFSWKSLVESLLPIMFNRWWFITVFMLLICIRPFVGKFIAKLSDKELLILIICIGFFDCIQAVFGNNAFSEKGAGFLHACYMLILGHGIRRMSMNSRIEKHKSAMIYIGSCITAGVLSILGKLVLHKEDAVAAYYNSPMIVIASIGFFSFFATWKCDWKWPGKIAPYVLAIYLINDHPMIRKNIYELLQCKHYYNSNCMVIHWLVCTVGFVITGISADYIFTSFEKSIKNLLRR